MKKLVSTVKSEEAERFKKERPRKGDVLYVGELGGPGRVQKFVLQD